LIDPALLLIAQWRMGQNAFFVRASFFLVLRCFVGYYVDGDHHSSKEASMQTFTLHETAGRFLITNGDAANTLRIDSLQDLLRLRQRLNAYVDTQQADSPIPDGPFAAPEWIDTVKARKLAADLGHGEIPATTVRSACERGNIAGARKRSRSGRAKTKGGGQWEFPRWAFLQWLRERKP
jgi:hypothetical protein